MGGGTALAGEEDLLIAIVVIVVAMVLQIGIIARRYVKVPPDQAMVVFGRRRGEVGYLVIGGGGGKFIVPIVEQYKFISLAAESLDIKVEGLITNSGVPLTVDAMAVIKISSDKSKLDVAVQHWLSKPAELIANVAREILTGQIRGVCAALEVEQINADRDGLAGRVRDAAQTSFDSLGLEIISLTIRDISDNVGYLEALGRRKVAEAKARAALAEKLAGLSEEELQRVLVGLEELARRTRAKPPGHSP